jgi:hypothetical protein
MSASGPLPGQPGETNPPHDLALTLPHDLALVPDLAHAPPDLAPPASLCANAGFVLCDGFESGLSGWGTIQNGGTVTVDHEHVYRGQWALHAHQNGDGGGDTGVAVVDVAYPSPDIYVRAFVFTSNPSPPSVTFARVQQSKGRQDSLDLQTGPTQFSVRESATAATLASNVPVPTGRWFCVEWQVHVSAIGFYGLSLDGQPRWTSSAHDTTLNPAYDWLVVGLDGSAGASNDLWIDELAVDRAPIGCAR